MPTEEVFLTNVSDCFAPAEDIEPGIQKMVLKTKQLYPEPEEHRQFEARLNEFLKIDNASKIMDYNDGLLTYLTESIVPPGGNTRLPLLLLFGNPAPESVLNKCIFAGEKGKKEHRFWPALEKSGIIYFKNTTADINPQRTKALLDLDYCSDFRIGLTVFYSMPSPASDPKWNGVAGLRRLFHAKALRAIADSEKRRINHLIVRFVAGEPRGNILAFQKDAYLGIRPTKNPETTVAEEGKWQVVKTQYGDSDINIYKLPPTRFMASPSYEKLLRKVRNLCK